MTDAESPPATASLTASLLASLPLELLPEDAGSLSAVAQHGDGLFLAGDGDDVLLRLSSTDGASFGRPRRLLLDTMLDRPRGFAGADIEGLCCARDEQGEWLWLTGSHSATRRRWTDAEDPGGVEHHPGRQLVARIPLIRDDAGLPLPVKRTEDGRRAGALPFAKGRNALLRALRRDKRLKPYLKLPAKDNGLDIEGIAVAGKRVLLGCRGPLIGGWALLLDLSLEIDDDGGLILPKAESALRLHWLDLDGLGIRDILIQGADLLILAGPVLAAPGPAALFRWPDALRRLDDPLIPRDRLTRFDLPAGAGTPEGLTTFTWPGRDSRLLMVRDGGLSAAELLPLVI